MIRLGRYDSFDKWEIVCQSWEGKEVDPGANLHGSPVLPGWRGAAVFAGRQACLRFLELRNEPPSLARYAVRSIARLPQTGFDSLFADLRDEMEQRLKDVFRYAALESLQWTEDVGEIPDIEMVRAKRRPFPRHSIRGKRNVLSMFCAWEFGVLDVIHIYDTGPDMVTLVDLDRDCIDAMKQIYPPEWNYICADYKEFLKEAETQDKTFDLVIADPWTSMCTEVAFDMLPTISERCTDMMVLHYMQPMFDELGAGPDDFPGLSRAIKQRTGVDVLAVDWIERSMRNGYLVLRKQR